MDHLFSIGHQEEEEEEEEEVVDHQIVIEKVCELYEKISKLDTLKPSEDVNTLFTELVETCIPIYPNLDVTKLPDKKIQQIRSNLITLCGEAEGHLEFHYSTILGSFQYPLHHLSLFPYFSNYLKLTQLEYTILTQQHFNMTPNPNPPSKLAFIGSGPLPLTSILLATHHLTQTTFHNYDIDFSANSLASKLVQSDPDLSSRMLFHTTNILDVCTELKDFDVVFLAALVGMNMEDKVRVIDHLGKHMAPGALLMLRSAHGARAFLYPVVQPSHLRGFEVLSVFHPTDEVINSVVIARKLFADHHHHHHQAPGILLGSPNDLILPINNYCCYQQQQQQIRVGLNNYQIINLMEELAVEDHIA